jgi:nanoRNase/pAp phosphatase (c-di-AMP/oligoRNAs hydrolase)
MEVLKDIVVIYHAQCRDGFGAAYAAWKKFGNTATYLPMRNQSDLDVELKDKEIFVLDYSFDKEVDDALRANNKSVVVIDHHQTAGPAVTAHPENIFDQSHSGAVLSWQYFHPDVPVPPLLYYVEDHDLWKFALPNHREYNAAVNEYPMTFTDWDRLIQRLTDDEFVANMIETGATIVRFEDKLVDSLLQYKERALFEGHEIWVLNVSRTYRSILGHKLAKLNKESGGMPLSIVYYHHRGAVSLSLRSEDDIDVAEIALKYGGGGHKHAAGIKVDSFADLPFTII